MVKGEELEQIYARRFGKTRVYRNKVWTVLCGSFFHRLVKRDDRVLDLGCGYGDFINQIECGERFGMDLNPASREFLEDGVEFLEQDCSTRWPFKDGELDVVFTSNFFEHLPNKEALERTLEEVGRCLREGGKLVALGPNYNRLHGKYWDFWDHHVALTELSLKELLELKGFMVTMCERSFLPYTMEGGRMYPLWFVSLYLKLKIAWLIFGKQFLVVGEWRAAKEEK
ncbi:MAG: class I SAM-dependent methyltransferase [Verrucomicrobiota bacterium]